MVTDVLNVIIKEGSVTDDWLKSVIMNVYKEKGDALHQRIYRGLKLLY